MGNTARDQNSSECSNYHISGNRAPSGSSLHRRSGASTQSAEGGEWNGEGGAKWVKLLSGTHVPDATLNIKHWHQCDCVKFQLALSYKKKTPFVTNFGCGLEPQRQRNHFAVVPFTLRCMQAPLIPAEKHGINVIVRCGWLLSFRDLFVGVVFSINFQCVAQ